MIGNKYILKPASRNPWMMKSFDGVPLESGSVITVLETVKCSFNDNIIGVVKVEVNGVEYTFDENHLVCWCFFTDCMTNDDEYGIYEIRVFESAGVVCESTCETEYLMQGKNGERLQESVKRLRGYGIDKEKAERISKNTEKAYLEKYGTKPLEDRYNEWVIENFHIYDLFCRFTMQAIESGRGKISHWLIINRIRWEVEVETKGICEEDREYKISNDYIAFIARDFIKDYPQHSGIFNLKQMKRV